MKKVEIGNVYTTGDSNNYELLKVLEVNNYWATVRRAQEGGFGFSHIAKQSLLSDYVECDKNDSSVQKIFSFDKMPKNVPPIPNTSNSLKDLFGL